MREMGKEACRNYGVLCRPRMIADPKYLGASIYIHKSHQHHVSRSMTRHSKAMVH